MQDAERTNIVEEPGRGSRWVAALAGGSGERLRTTLDALPIDVLARYPMPRRGGLPFGRELSILATRVRGRSIQLQSSGLTRLYSSLAPADHRILYRAFTLGESMSRGEWQTILGDSDISLWERSGLLLASPRGLHAAFRVVVFAGLRLLVDAFAHQERFADRVHVGKDTLTLLDFMAKANIAPERHLDVGTGSGALLLTSRQSERLGVDVNRRAVEVARFNAALNRRACAIQAGDIFEMGPIGRFDLVTWNLPFHFMPPAERADNVDGYGGDMGIELTLRFVELLPALLTDPGRACLLTSSPTLRDGTELLLKSLRERAPHLGLDIRMIAIQALWSPARKHFYHARGIRRIDNVILDIRCGRGLIDRVDAPIAQRGIDWVQGLRYGAYR